jgi:Domain of unknown function (DUF1772)
MSVGFPWLEFLGLILAGILAGEELIVRYGVHPALGALEDERMAVSARQALVRRLRIVVPAIMVPAVLLGLAVLIFGGSGPGLNLRWMATMALVGFVALSFLGTVPINIRVNGWDPEAPPEDWKAVVHRWEVIDIFRSSAALLAFVLYLAALAVQLM